MPMLLTVTGLLAAAGITALVIRLLFNKPVLMIYLQIVYCSTIFYAISDLGVWSGAKYLTDLITLMLLLQLFFRRRSLLRINANIRSPLLAAGGFATICLAGVVVNAVIGGFSPLFFMWGVRVYFRCYVFFAACIAFLDLRHVKDILKYLVAILPVQAVFASVQKLMQGYDRDRIGGLFGTSVGCNGQMNVYLLIAVTALVVWYLSGRVSLPPTVAGIGLSLYIAALSELKGLFFEIALIIAIVSAVYHSRRALRLTLSGAALVTAAIVVFVSFYPQWRDFFTLDAVYEYIAETGYAGSGSLNRLTAGPYMLGHVLPNNFQRLFGVGLGNADYFLNFHSEFYQKYNHMRYQWFLYSMLIVETGILGLTAYLLHFAATARDSVRTFLRLRASGGNRHACVISAVMCVMAFILVVYNASMHAEAGYFVFFITAIPYIVQKEATRSDVLCPDR